jgi:hypothetical protein
MTLSSASTTTSAGKKTSHAAGETPAVIEIRYPRPGQAGV